MKPISIDRLTELEIEYTAATEEVSGNDLSFVEGCLAVVRILINEARGK